MCFANPEPFGTKLKIPLSNVAKHPPRLTARSKSTALLIWRGPINLTMISELIAKTGSFCSQNSCSPAKPALSGYSHPAAESNGFAPKVVSSASQILVRQSLINVLQTEAVRRPRAVENREPIAFPARRTVRQPSPK